MGTTSVQKDINDLKKMVVANGFKVVPNGRGHMKLLDKKGRVVTDANGPVIWSGTSSEIRGRDMAVKRLLGVGALKEDPWKPAKPKSEEEKQLGKAASLHTEEAKQRRRERELAEAKRRAENTRKVRERIEPFVVAIGGWEKKGVKAELARAAFHYLKTMNRVECWSTVASAEQGVFTMSKGNTLSDRIVDAWHLFMDEIDRAGPTIEARRERYFELVAQSKGLLGQGKGGGQARPTPGSNTEKEQVEAEPVEARVVELVAPPARRLYETPTLALRALQEMTAGAGLSPDRRAEALKIAEEILDLEIAQMNGRVTGVQAVH